jgi:hypothetical protein
VVNRFLPRAFQLILTLFFVSCQSNNSPVLQALNVNKSSGVAPLAVRFSWIAASDPDNDALSCSLDTDSDGTPDFGIFDCSQNTVQLFNYQNPGNFVATLTVSDSKGAFVSRSANVNVTVPAVLGSYNIELRYSASFPAKFKPAFQAAAARWQSIVVGDVPDSNSTFLPSQCGVTGQTSIVGVDDLVIWVDTIPYDAKNPNLLGQAGPCF